LAFPEEISHCGFKNPQETITHEGITWECKSLAKSAGNLFPADFSLDSAEKSAGKSRISSSVHAETEKKKPETAPEAAKESTVKNKEGIL